MFLIIIYLKKHFLELFYYFTINIYLIKHCSKQIRRKNFKIKTKKKLKLAKNNDELSVAK